MGKTERGQETHEAGWPGGSAAGSLPGALESHGRLMDQKPTPFEEAGPAPTPEPLSARVADAAPARRKSIVREYAEAIVLAMLLAFAIRVFVVQAFKIPSGSMIPTLLIGDHILVSKLSYGLQWPSDCKFRVTFPPVTCYTSHPVVSFGDPQRGDVIVF